ncbi:hypothetical protein IMG5_165650 [Ichthyophthirius multifiliis]|uniref:Uncharacterized protein n=1 Tax=Ichthyophthirius multifiliis TaxID=5932 RepID=G0R0M5_ICHMU|nr:hypothetical protein IMG5_165650 [Ichthyophthirius multifiliis]EGR28969.1 hypothetical protein IMG5_165650 [Ichthyophthirius multifiliis]|eukprot:XP_004030205.1 hypothetical protein IMG5_165650 [Ichthyophthirius multifiliis]
MSSICHFFSLIWHGYVYSLYYLSTTMISGGSNDLPLNMYECVFGIVCMFTTGMAWAYCLNTIGNIINSLGIEKQKYEDDMLQYTSI